MPGVPVATPSAPLQSTRVKPSDPGKDHMISPGHWVCSVEDQQPVQVLAVLDTWGGPTLRVWAPTSGQVFLRTTDRTRPIASPELAHSQHSVAYAAAGARIADALCATRSLHQSSPR